MLFFGGCYSGIVCDQSHFYCNLSRRGIGIWTYQKETPFIRKPFIVNPFHNTYRIIEMLKNMSQNYVIIFFRKRSFFKKSVNKFYITKFFFCYLNGFIRCFYTGYIIKKGGKTPCKITFKTPEFQTVSIY